MCNGAILAQHESPFYVDARMTPNVPLKTTVTKTGRLFQELSDLLLSGLEFIGATAGWIGLQESGGLNFPVRIGVFSDSWLPGQQAHGSIWGFTINDETAVLNDLTAEPKCGDPALRNLLSSPLIQNEQILGHLALANKATGFSAEDAVVVRGLAHHMARLLCHGQARTHLPINLSAGWRRILDRTAEGVLILDQSGVLIYANSVWLEWTDLPAEQLLGTKAPFPFWIGQHELVQALNSVPVAPAGALPFRRRDQSLFWCAVEAASEQWDDHLVTIAFLRQTPTPTPIAAIPILPSSLLDEGEAGGDNAIEESKPMRVCPPSLDWLPLLLDLDSGIEGWEARWEARTGLSVQDVKGLRCELVLDWLFPQQHDRNRVADCLCPPQPEGCQLILEVAVYNESRPMLCTFIPLPAHTAIAAPRRWLLLVGEMQQCARSEMIDGASYKEPAPIRDSPIR